MRWPVTVVALVAPLLAAAQPAVSDDELAAKATDPTAQLMSFQLTDAYVASLPRRRRHFEPAVFRAAIPFDLAAPSTSFALRQPYATSSRAGSAWSTPQSLT